MDPVQLSRREYGDDYRSRESRRDTYDQPEPNGLIQSVKTPDHGQSYMPVGNNLPNQAPQPLDHFKRGYMERATLRDRDVGHVTPATTDRNGDTPTQTPPISRSTSSFNRFEKPLSQEEKKLPQSLGDLKKYRSSDREGAKEYYRGSKSTPSYYDNRKTYDDDKQFSRSNNYNDNYNKYDDKQFTRSYTEDHRSRDYSHGSQFNSHKGYNSGFSMEEVVDRLCYPRSNVSEEMDRARKASPESFSSGRAITAILSQLGRLRQMNVAMMVWHWMERTEGIQRNVFHFNALINVCEKIKDWKRALDLLRQMDEERVPKNEITYSSAISACEKGGNWRMALDLLNTMKKNGIMPTAIAYNAAISACEKGLNPSKALEIFDEMKREGVRPTVITFSALISACEKGQQWKLALQVLEEMKRTFGPNVIAYSAAISALSKGQQWEKAWELFCEIERSGEKLSVVTYNATMTALEKGLQWQRALDLFDEMKFKNMDVTVVSYGSVISACEKGYQWRQCLEYLDEMTERKIPKNVIIFGAAMSCMEKSCRADIAFQLMDRMKLEGVRPNVHIYNSAISACARCKLWKKGYELFKEMDDVGIKRDVVTYNAVLDAVYSQMDLAKNIFHEGVERGFYAKVSRLGTQWLELDLHFLSLGGGETALRWWFEECLVPYLGNSRELASVKSIDIVTGYGKTRSRGARKGDDGMRKRVRAMLSFMNLTEIDQPNLGRIHIDKESLRQEVERNGGRIIFDAYGYEQYKLKEGLDDSYVDAEQFIRPRGGAIHPRNKRDKQGEDLWVNNGGGMCASDRQGTSDGRSRSDDGSYYKDRDSRPDNCYSNEGQGKNGGSGYRDDFHTGSHNPPKSNHSHRDKRPSPQDNYSSKSFHKQQRDGGDRHVRVPSDRYEDPESVHDGKGNFLFESKRESTITDSRQNFHTSRYNENKRTHDSASSRHDREDSVEHRNYNGTYEREFNENSGKRESGYDSYPNKRYHR